MGLQQLDITGFDPRLARRAPASTPLATPTREPWHARALANIVEAHVIPRLVLESRAGPAPRAESPIIAPLVLADDVATMIRLSLGSNDGTVGHALALRARGVPVETLFLELLTPVAIALGEMWKDDTADFMQVTLGVGRLTRAMHRVAATDPMPVRADDRHILLLPAPGEQHTFGLAMVAEFFRRAGWRVTSSPGSSRAELTTLLDADRYGVVAFSAVCDAPLAALADAIRVVRRATRASIMIGGALVNERPGLARLLGADATASDGRQAVRQAEALVALRARAA